MTKLVLSAIHKAFGQLPVLTGVDLTVPEGSLTAVLGPSGSGKTTLLRIVAGFERPDSGRVTLGETVVAGHGRATPPERRGIGYVPQEGALFPHLTVAGNVRFGIRRLRRSSPGRDGAPGSPSSIDELLELVGLSGLGSRFPHQLSGGQQQRVALARALAIQPALVLLDEPFSSLDASLRASVRSDVHDVLRARGTTAVLVSHDQDEALSVADQVAVIRDGRIGQRGTPRQLYQHPADPELARFLGDANLVNGMLAGGRVSTPFGTVQVRAGTTTRSGPVVALIRPEQLSLSPGDDPGGASRHSGLRGKVVRTEFHGHDLVVTVDPGPASGCDLLTVRADGRQDVVLGSQVSLAVTGTVVTWSTNHS